MSDPLSVAASVAGLVSLGLQSAEHLYKFYKAYRDQHKELAQITGQLDGLLKTLRIIVETINTRKWRVGEEEILKAIQEAVNSSEGVIHDLQNEAEKFKNVSDGDWKKKAIVIGRRAAYPFKRSTLEDLGEDVETFRANLSIALQALELKEHQNTQNDIEVVNTIVRNIQAQNVDAGLRQWLKAPDAIVDFNIAFAKRHHGTGQWLVDDPTFKTWLQKDNSFLWLHGFAGCGKSVLCSTAIHDVLRVQKFSASAAVAFFFFSFRDESKQDASAAIRAIMTQLCSQIPGLEADLSLLKQSSNSGVPSIQAMLDCLRMSLTRCRHIYLIIDALDESPVGISRSEVLKTIDIIRAWGAAGVHLLVTSRDIQDIRDALNSNFRLTNEDQLTLKNDCIEQDISRYITYQVDHDVLLSRWGEACNKIKKYLTENAGGVFRWVDCQLDPLRRCPKSQRILDKCLRTLPRDLDQTYERILCQIGEDWRKEAQQILSLLCYASRPLSIDEVLEVTAVDRGDFKAYDQGRRLESTDDLLQICSGLIEITTAPLSNINYHVYSLDYDDSKAKEMTIQIVRVAHFSVQEYLLSDRIRNSNAREFALSADEQHAQISDMCLLYLSHSGLIEPPLSINLVKQYAFAKYAARNWYHHHHQIKGDVPEYLLERTFLFLTADNLRQRWFRLNDVEHPGKNIKYDDLAEDVPSAIYWASSLGLDGVLFRLLSKPVTDINKKEGLYGNALQAASKFANEDVVQMLMAAGADVNVQGGYCGNALHAASASGRQKVVQLLLDAGAEINADGGEYGNALQAASYNGNEKVVQILLEAGADINARRGEYDTALLAAAIKGNEEVLQVLMDAGADMNIKPGYSGILIRTAAYRGHDKAVKILMERGADFNAPSKILCLNALFMALIPSDVDTIRVLVEGGADVNSRNIHGQTALICSIISNDSAVSRLLVHLQADCSIADFNGRTAVDWLKLQRTDDQLLQSICKNPESPAALNTKQVREGIASYSTSILQHQLNHPQGLFNQLGHCLLVLGDEGYASLAFERMLGLVDDTGNIYHTAVSCDACKMNPIQGSRFICTICPTTDLCTECMEGHREDRKLDRCRAHEF